ncbi:trifunctional NAD biosynthesis/regulator protein [Exiguobacterium phage vB_EalM-132]|nr:trifunctional NAD biosynthesis/regulator protein [Exiguobacterium phage vB_EalM-132]
MSKKTVGFYGGKFFPIHKGHVAMMEKARMLVDELHIIVSYDVEAERKLWKTARQAGHPRPTHIDRYRWWSEITKYSPNVHVHTVNELQTGKDTDWDRGAIGIREAIGKPIDVVFSSEPSYERHFSRLYPEAVHFVLDEEREQVDISATKIRENLYWHWNALPEEVRPFFVRKVVIVGTESCGKSTLVRRLAEHYGTNYVEEYGRTFYERMGVQDMRYVRSDDFSTIAMKQWMNVVDSLDESNRIIFVDTEAVVTEYYHKLYAGWKINTKVPYFQEYDLYLYLTPEVAWVDDGSRTLRTQKEREEQDETLVHMFDQQNIYPTFIRGTSYDDRFNQAVKAINKLLK